MLQHEEVSREGISKMVAVATQNIIKEAKKKKLGRDANLDPDKEIQNTRRIKKVLKQQDITLDSFHMKRCLSQISEAAKVLRRQIRIQELIDDGAWRPGVH